MYILHFIKYEKDECTVGALYNCAHTRDCRIFTLILQSKK